MKSEILRGKNDLPKVKSRQIVYIKLRSNCVKEAIILKYFYIIFQPSISEFIWLEWRGLRIRIKREAGVLLQNRVCSVILSGSHWSVCVCVCVCVCVWLNKYILCLKHKATKLTLNKEIDLYVGKSVSKFLMSNLGEIMKYS